MVYFCLLETHLERWHGSSGSGCLSSTSHGKNSALGLKSPGLGKGSTRGSQNAKKKGNSGDHLLVASDDDEDVSGGVSGEVSKDPLKNRPTMYLNHHRRHSRRKLTFKNLKEGPLLSK